MNSQPATVEELQQAICSLPRLLPKGGGTKPALSTPPAGVAILDLARISGVKKYDPAEFTFTALAGTPLKEVSLLLAQHGQYLPFDPPLAGRGATLGGTVAAGLSGPGRYQFGGVRDFILAVSYVDGQGQVVRGGAKVVKNAAGYDLPKLVVGSLGQFGVLVELTFKVLPEPEATATAIRKYASIKDALQALVRLSTSPLDPNAIEIHPLDGNVELWVRLSGPARAMPARLERLTMFIGDFTLVQEMEEETLWHGFLEMEWVPSDWSLVKIPLTLSRIPALELALSGLDGLRHYSGGGQLLWLACPAPVQTLNELLLANQLSGLVIFGPPGLSRLGVRAGASFERRVKMALDPLSRFVEA
jgi:glycolate oxidase FAD binding subunit